VTHDEALVLVTTLIGRIRQVSPAHFTADEDLVDALGFDSLDVAELLAALHRETGRQLDLASLERMRTVRDIAAGLEAR